MSSSVTMPVFAGTLHAGAPVVPIIPYLRAIGSHLIVWHHLVFYGPVSEIAYELSPGLFDWLIEYARMAVQVFFVLGGFVTARKLARPMRWTLATLAREVVARYRRVGIPYLVVLVVAVVANHLARQAMDHESISAPPTLMQLIAHAAFMQNLLGYESLSAGIWYLGVDFQLGLFVLLTLAACQRLCGGDERQPERGFLAAQWLFWPVAVVSLLWLNRVSACDSYAVYFFGSYFGGMVVAWVIEKRLPKTALLVYAGLVSAALVVEWRPRLAVALATGLAVVLSHAIGRLRQGAWWSFVNFWSDRSYSLFLIHFPVCLVTTAWLAELVDDRPRAAMGVLVLEYGLSLLAAIVFYQLVERQIPRWLSARHNAGRGRALPAGSN